MVKKYRKYRRVHNAQHTIRGEAMGYVGERRRVRETSLEKLAEVKSELVSLNTVITAMQCRLDNKVRNRVTFFFELCSKVENGSEDASLAHAIGHGIKVANELKEFFDETFEKLFDSCEEDLASLEFTNPSVWETHREGAEALLEKFDADLDNLDYIDMVPTYCEVRDYFLALKKFSPNFEPRISDASPDSEREWILKLKKDLNLTP